MTNEERQELRVSIAAHFLERVIPHEVTKLADAILVFFEPKIAELEAENARLRDDLKDGRAEAIKEAVEWHRERALFHERSCKPWEADAHRESAEHFRTLIGKSKPTDPVAAIYAGIDETPYGEADMDMHAAAVRAGALREAMNVAGSYDETCDDSYTVPAIIDAIRALIGKSAPGRPVDDMAARRERDYRLPAQLKSEP